MSRTFASIATAIAALPARQDAIDTLHRKVYNYSITNFLLYYVLLSPCFCCYSAMLRQRNIAQCTDRSSMLVHAILWERRVKHEDTTGNNIAAT